MCAQMSFKGSFSSKTFATCGTLMVFRTMRCVVMFAKRLTVSKYLVAEFTFVCGRITVNDLDMFVQVEKRFKTFGAFLFFEAHELV